MITHGREAEAEYARLRARSAGRRQGARGAPRRGAPTNPTLILAGLVASLGGWWWDKRTGITIATGVSAWVDRVRGATLSQGTASKQPAYNATTGLTSDGVDDFLSGASGLLNGAPGYTWWFCGSTTGGVYLGTYGASILGLYTSGGFHAFLQAGAPFNEWNSGTATPLARAVYTCQGQWSDGTTAQKIIYKDGVTAGGSRDSAGDVSAGAFGTQSLVLFAATSASGFGAQVAQHHIIVPSQVSAAVIAQVSSLLHQIEGF